MEGQNEKARNLAVSGPRFGELEGMRLSATLPRTGLVLEAIGPQAKLMAHANETESGRHGDLRPTLACNGTSSAKRALQGCGAKIAVHDGWFCKKFVVWVAPGKPWHRPSCSMRCSVKAFHNASSDVVKNIHIKYDSAFRDATSQGSSTSSSASRAVSTSLTTIRRQAVQALFQAFAEERIAAGDQPKGLDAAFAKHLDMSPATWSMAKSGRRPIGDKLARQIEHRCGKTALWLDEEREPQGVSHAEQQFLSMALKAWRSTNAEGRKRLKLLMREQDR